jgi:hypothetical protein
MPVLGYDIAADGGHLVVNAQEAEQVREMFRLYRQCLALAIVVHQLQMLTSKLLARLEPSLLVPPLRPL